MRPITRRAVLSVIVLAFAVCGATLAFAQAAKVDLTGKWLFDVQTDAGSGTPTVTLKQQGDKLTGHYNGQLGDVDVAGSVKGSDFSFAFSADLQGNRFDVTYKGTIENKDALKGTMSMGGVGNGTFTAKRQ